MWTARTVCFLGLLTAVLGLALPPKSYLRLRDDIVEEEDERALGGALTLKGNEIPANECLMNAKYREVDDAFEHPTHFLPARNFFEVRDEIERSEVFRIIRKMPKGAVFHVHSTAVASFDYLAREVLVMPHLYVCYNRHGVIRFRFFEAPDGQCDWKLVEDLLAKDPSVFEQIRLMNDAFFLMNMNHGLTTLMNQGHRANWRSITSFFATAEMKEIYVKIQFFNKICKENQYNITKHRSDMAILSNYSTGAEHSVEDVWNTFEETFDIVHGLIKYRPAFEKFFTAALQELYDDNVMYAEIRSGFSKLYELNGTQHSVVETAYIYKQVIDRFVEEHPDFIGAKVIYSSYRRVSQEDFDTYVNNFRKLKEALPDFVIGFDLVGQEDKGWPLIEFAEKLQKLSKETPFFFHAGETNWYGHSADENLIDAVILNTRRIGHGYALLKHPKLMQIVKERNIAIELNPISNQVLGLVRDLRNHPASYFFAENFPVVVSNDDPSFWGASGLSHDFYEAFVGIMSREADLRALKQLAINSIVYSEMTAKERGRALRVWERQWTRFIRDLKSSCQGRTYSLRG